MRYHVEEFVSVFTDFLLKNQTQDSEHRKRLIAGKTLQCSEENLVLKHILTVEDEIVLAANEEEEVKEPEPGQGTSKQKNANSIYPAKKKIRKYFQSLLSRPDAN